MALSIAWTITRIELALSALNVNDGSNYELFAIGLGPRAWTHRTADEDWVDGEDRVHSKLQEAQRSLGIRVKGSSMANLGANMVTLVAAVSQTTYTTGGTIDGYAIEWRDCGPADLRNVPRLYSEGESLDPAGLIHKQQDLMFVIPADPADYAGPW